MTTALSTHDENDAAAHEALPVETGQLRLHVAGTSPRLIAAPGNFKRIGEENLHGPYDIEVIIGLDPLPRKVNRL